MSLQLLSVRLAIFTWLSWPMLLQMAITLQPFGYFHLCGFTCSTRSCHDFTTSLQPFGHFLLAVWAYAGLCWPWASTSLCLVWLSLCSRLLIFIYVTLVAELELL